MSVELMDGRTLTVPLAWYPRLLCGTPTQRGNWQTSGAGFGIHWADSMRTSVSRVCCEARRHRTDRTRKRSGNRAPANTATRRRRVGEERVERGLVDDPVPSFRAFSDFDEVDVASARTR